MSGVRPVVLVILDGWGIAPSGPGNAIESAKTPVFDFLLKHYPSTTLKTSGRDVGLVEGQMGNSEVGHLNIGAGFVVNQLITSIDLAIEDESLFGNQALVRTVRSVKDEQRTLHLLGLVSDGGVHSHIRHLDALLELCRREQLDRVVIHAILDGRDTLPTSGAGFLQHVEETCSRLQVGQLATIIGRYYAMDRDRRWERTRIAFDLLVEGDGILTSNAIGTVLKQYESGTTDEFMPAVRIDTVDPNQALVRAGDYVIFFNFRTDRPRQLTQALVGPDPEGYLFPNRPTGIKVTGLTSFSSDIEMEAAFEPTSVDFPLARVVSEAGLLQFHIAETEKYAHVTYFLNGGREEPFEGEDRQIVASPPVATYDLQPEMSASEVATAAADVVETGNHELVIVNFANCDMVGHTGSIESAVAATEAVDSNLGKLVDATIQAGGCLLIIADHGNAEQMLVPGTNQPMTAHTSNPVPCILVGSRFTDLDTYQLRSSGRLADIAPTLLQLLNIEQPDAMTGTSLLIGDA